jgi:protein phosphatase/serine/threonine-protein phosphatase Stp1
MSERSVPVLPSSAATHPGAVRIRNEDSLVDRPELGLWAVADGAGGHGSGDVASQAIAAALQGISSCLSAPELLATVRATLADVHADLQRRASQAGVDRIMASTVAVALVRDGHFACLWAGDSRIYLVRGGGLRRLTRDHSLVQQLIDEGRLTPDQAETDPRGNIILRAIGGSGDLELEKVSGRLELGDQLMLCTDGVFKTLAEPDLAALLATGTSAREIIDRAVALGARDNVTVVLVGDPFV